MIIPVTCTTTHIPTGSSSERLCVAWQSKGSGLQTRLLRDSAVSSLRRPSQRHSRHIGWCNHHLRQHSSSNHKLLYHQHRMRKSNSQLLRAWLPFPIVQLNPLLGPITAVRVIPVRKQALLRRLSKQTRQHLLLRRLLVSTRQHVCTSTALRLLLQPRQSSQRHQPLSLHPQLQYLDLCQ